MDKLTSLTSYVKFLDQSVHEVSNNLKAYKEKKETLDDSLKQLETERDKVQARFRTQFSGASTFTAQDLAMIATYVRDYDEQIKTATQELLELTAELQSLESTLSTKLSEKKSIEKLIETRTKRGSLEQLRNELSALDDQYLLTRPSQ